MQIVEKRGAYDSLVRMAVILSSCLAITGCMTRSFIFNGVPYPDPVSAKVAVDAFYSKIESDVKPAVSTVPKKLVVVIPSQLYARTHWIMKAGFASLTEDQYQFIAGQLIKDCQSFATYLNKAKAFESVQVVEASVGSVDLPENAASIAGDLVLKKAPAGHWTLTPFPSGPSRDVKNPVGLSGRAAFDALVESVQTSARSF